MTRREIPEPWLLLMQKRGLDSGRALAEKMGVSQQTVQRMLHGEQTSDDTIARASDVLGVSVKGLWALRGETPPPPFHLPKEADQLSPKQRAAVLAVVRAMLEPGDAMAETSSPTAENVHPLRPAARERKNVPPGT